MTKLTDLQLVLLSTAAARGDGSLLPPAHSITTQAGRIHRAMATLVRRELAADVVVSAQALSYRADGDALFGATITDAGRRAIGTEPAPNTGSTLPADVPSDAIAEGTAAASDPAAVASGDPAASATPSAPRAGTKSALVIELLGRDHGATIEELTAATGWLPHTTRAALTGLRKKRHAIVRSSRDGAACYSVAAAAV